MGVFASFLFDSSDPQMKLFLSYRRADDESFVGRLRDALVHHFGEGTVFFDVDSARPGQDMRVTIRTAIKRCDFVLAIIGPRWDLARLIEPGDYVFAELKMALESTKPIFPVVINDARMPSASQLPDVLRDLSYINAFRIRSDPDFSVDVRTLVNSLREVELDLRPKPPPTSSKGRPGSVLGFSAGVIEGRDVVLAHDAHGPITGYTIARGIAAAPGLAAGYFYTYLDSLAVLAAERAPEDGEFHRSVHGPGHDDRCC
jgi:hypothetical protein